MMAKVWKEVKFWTEIQTRPPSDRSISRQR